MPAGQSDTINKIRMIIENPVCNTSGLPEEKDLPDFIDPVFNLSEKPVLIFGYPSGNIEYTNKSAVLYYKSLNLDAVSLNISDIFISVESDCENKVIAKIKDNSCEGVRLKFKSAEFSHNEKNYIAMILEGGFSDCKETKRSRDAIFESEILHRTTIDAIHDALVVVNRDLGIEIYNRAFGRITGYNNSSGELQGKNLQDIAPYLTGKLCLEYRYVFTSGETLDTTVKHREDGGLTIYEVLKSPIFEDGEVVKVLTILRDRTRSYQLEELKKEAFFQIEKNMEQFAILNDHIRNPLQGIVGLADLEGGSFGEKIILQAMEIDSIVRKLDTGWIESDKVRDMLSKHYGITVKRRPNVKSPIGMLKTRKMN
ncbi:PAS domain-containing protein [Methanoplanus sp. FWC-SCC4]|uniref:PAS domain-containing protein n=1 Tax=Methanochimaera problematica TaxID=2609417 RepID=A0AA97I2W0_9EURY|nr:PAS domain-containing protein [Methanoplanus sp. FWC-SCC4]WOF16710.1 PAS domain-containing protein [Methanoplanus sp. FWC-SCC4]